MLQLNVLYLSTVFNIVVWFDRINRSGISNKLTLFGPCGFIITLLMHCGFNLLNSTYNLVSVIYISRSRFVKFFLFSELNFVWMHSSHVLSACHLHSNAVGFEYCSLSYCHSLSLVWFWPWLIMLSDCLCIYRTILDACLLFFNCIFAIFVSSLVLAHDIC